MGVHRGVPTGLGAILESTLLEEGASMTMHAWAIPVHEDGAEVLQLLVQAMQHKDKWRVSVPLLLFRMQRTSGVGSRSKLACSAT